MNVAVVGSRDFGNRGLVNAMLTEYVGADDRVVSGGAKGVDTWAEEWALIHTNKPPKIIPADWDKYGKSAGYKRNPVIIANGELVLAFWDGKSKGTVDSIRLGIEVNKPVLVWLPDGTKIVRGV